MSGDGPSLIGQVVGGTYRVLSLIGQGGMGTVYAAFDERAACRVAIKVLAKEALAGDREAFFRFDREARAARAIESEHVVRVLDSGVDVALGLPFLAMELVTGADLEQLIRRLGPLSTDVALRIAAQACAGLRCAHEAGVIHRDIKPQNLYLSRGEGGEVRVKVLDFGIAKWNDVTSNKADHSLTRTGSLLGSPMFMSPEQARGLRAIDHRTDIWSLGAVLYEVLSGRTPHHGIEALGALLFAITSEPVKPIQEVAPWVAPEIAAIVECALSIHPNDRFSSAAEMLAALGPLLADGSALNEWMLLPVSATERAIVRPRLTAGPSSARVPSFASSAAKPASFGFGPASSTPPRRSADSAALALAVTRRLVRRSLTSLIVGSCLLVLAAVAVWRGFSAAPPVSSDAASPIAGASPTPPSNRPVAGAAAGETAGSVDVATAMAARPAGPTVTPSEPSARPASDPARPSADSKVRKHSEFVVGTHKGRLIRQSLD